MNAAVDLTCLSPEQQAAVAVIAQREAASLIARVLTGANERLHLALSAGIVELPVFHLRDIARMAAGSSSGKETYVSGGDA